MKYQSPPALDESCSQLYRVVPSPPQRSIGTRREAAIDSVDSVAVHPVDERADGMHVRLGVDGERRAARGGAGGCLRQHRAAEPERQRQPNGADGRMPLRVAIHALTVVEQLRTQRLADGAGPMALARWPAGRWPGGPVARWPDGPMARWQSGLFAGPSGDGAGEDAERGT